MKKPTEEALQSKCYSYILENRRDLLMFQVPNEAVAKTASMFLKFGIPQSQITKISAQVYSLLRNMGFVKGVSDTILIGQGKVHFVEFKLPNEKQRQEQVRFEEKVKQLGHNYIVIYSLSDFKTFVETLPTLNI